MFPPLHRPQHHWLAAPWARPTGCWIQPPPHVPNMLAPRLPRLRQTTRLDQRTDFVHLSPRQHSGPERLYIPREPHTRRHVCRHRSLERGFTHENYYRPHRACVQIQRCQHRLHCLHVPIILTQRILKRVFLSPSKHLRPPTVALVPEYPPTHVLRLHDEHPESRNEYMIDLRRPVRHPQRHIVEPPESRRGQRQPCPQCDLRLPDETLHSPQERPRQ